jgi:hypothetical protein
VKIRGEEVAGRTQHGLGKAKNGLALWPAQSALAEKINGRVGGLLIRVALAGRSHAAAH